MNTRLADVVYCPDQVWSEWGRKVPQKHIDFVLYDRKTTEIVLAIELDDRSHERPERVKRDDFVEQKLANAGVAMRRFAVARHYDHRDIRGDIKAVINLRGWLAA